MNQGFYIILGLIAGTLSGVLGVGGAVILIPVLVYIFGFSQHLAQGTSLAAMVPPIGFLAALHYYQNGNVKISAAILICIGFFFGGFIGAEIAHKLSGPLLKKLFGALLFFVSLKMFFGK
jgi:uncharacterized membrane protein YfcA